MAVIKTTPKTAGTTGGANRPVETTSVAKAPASTRPGGTGVATRSGVSRAPQSAPKPSRAFLADTQTELRRVVWPTREEVRSGTIVTVLLLLVFGAYVFGLDSFFAWLFNSLGLYSDTGPRPS